MAFWRLILRKNFTRWKELAEFLQLDEIQIRQIDTQPNFPLNVPLRLAQKIEKGTLEDPILKQFLPVVQERQEKEGFSCDPVCDSTFALTPKLLRKYHQRVLMLPTSACAMHCRYCFRQNFPYESVDKTFDPELQHIAQDASIQEVILSGGDPLSLSNQKLKQLLESLCRIPHVKKIRFHTRFPIGIPERIDDELIEILGLCRCQIVFIIHCNHPRELDGDVLSSLKSLQGLGIPVLSQSVLLKGVNDDVETLVRLSEVLTNHGIIPYYLHQLDRVRGSSHFEVSEEKGRHLIDALTASLPGYAVPKYVKEEPNSSSKTPLSR